MRDWRIFVVYGINVNNKWNMFFFFLFNNRILVLCGNFVFRIL